jgi:hypothetical protein
LDMLDQKMGESKNQRDGCNLLSKKLLS